MVATPDNDYGVKHWLQRYKIVTTIDLLGHPVAHFASHLRNCFRHSLRSLPRSSPHRTRVGPVGPEVAAVIPEAVEIIPKRTLPAKEKGGKPVEIFNVPVVHDQTLFMYGVGATKEMAKVLDEIRAEINEELTKSAEIEAEVLRLEELTAKSMDGGAEVRMRASLAEAKKLKAKLELEVERAKEETEYAEMLKEQELKQLERNEELVLDRLAREVRRKDKFGTM